MKIYSSIANQIPFFSGSFDTVIDHSEQGEKV